MTLKTYADWEEAVRVARVTYDHSQAKLVTGTKGVRKSKEKAFLSVLSTKRPLNNASSEIETPTSPGAQNTQATVLNSKRSSSQSTKTRKIQIFISTSWASSICLQLRPSTSVADLKRLLQERLGIDSEKQHLFTRKGLELCDALSIADHSIEHDATIELRLVSGLMGGRKKKRKSEKQQEPKQNLTSEDAWASEEHSSAYQISSSPEKRLEPERKPTQEDVSAGEESPSLSQKSSSTSGYAADPNRPTQSSVQIQNLTIKGVTNSPIILGPAVASSFNYAKIPVDVDAMKNGETHRESNATIVQMIKHGLRQHGKTHMMTLFTKAFVEFDAEVAHAQMGSVKLVLHVKSQKGLHKLWNMYTSGELAKTFTEILITDELTTEDKSNMAIKVTILESDYQEGCRFFEKLQKDTLKQETLPVRMSDWTKEHVKMWLLGIGVPDSVARELYEEEINGEELKIYNKDQLHEDFDMRKGHIRLILHHKDNWLKSEKRQLTSPSNSKQMLLSSTGESKEDSDQVLADAVVEKPEKLHTKAASQPVVRPKMPSSRQKDEAGRKTKIKQIGPSEQHQTSLVKASEKEERALYGENRGQESTEADIIIPPEDRITPFQNPLATNEGESKSKQDTTLLTFSPVPRESISVCRVKPPQFSPDSPSEAMSHKTSGEFPGNQMTSEPQPSKKYNEEHHGTSTYLQTQRDIPSDIKASIGQVSQNGETRLRTLLTGDECGELDQSYPLLVANKAPSLSLESSKTEYFRNVEFIKTIKWASVLDFDSQSLSDGLCKLYHDNRMVTLQQPNLFKNIESKEDLQTSIGFPEKTLWLFANGREDNPTIESLPMDLQEWNKERSRDVEASISFFSSVIPKGRAAIVFLLLSDQDLGIVCDIFRKMSSSFQGIQNITCITEDENVYAQFVKGVEKWFSKAEIDERSVVGLKWQDINRIMMRMHGVNQTGQHELPFRLPGKSCFLSAKQKEEWNDITVICKNECENTDVDESIQGYEKFAQKKELNYYRGAKVDWWNFVIDERERKRPHACGHVLKRNGFGKTLQEVVKPLDRSKSEDSLIVTVTLLHQPGAGGSTLGRQVLWELHKDHRCIVVDKITTNTVNQILGCRRYGYKEYLADIPPVCVLIDDFDDVEVLDLIGELEEASKDTPLKGGAVCVLLHCKRNMDPIETIKQIKTNSDLYVPLVQKLTEAEIEWFGSKYTELEDKENKFRTGNYKPQNLLAFMVMKKEFNKDYIKDVVSQILHHSDANRTEKGLIKMCAFLNSYMHEAEIPISCCDSFMEAGVKLQKTAYLNRRVLTNWEKSVSAPFKIIVLMTENRTIKILHESVAQEALKQILKDERQTIADVALEYLNSDLMRSWSYRKKDMAKITHDLLVRRTRLKPGDNTKTDFSRLIQDVYNCNQQGPKKATEILQTGFKILQDAFIAQQLARLHLKEKNFGKAVEFAEKALKLNPQKSYFWDTKGRVYNTHFNAITKKYLVEQQVLSSDVCKQVISLSFQAMEAFHKSYDVSKETMQTEYTGLYAEVDVAFRLLNVIQCAMEPFRTKGDINILRKYLLNLRLPPDCYPKFDEDCSSRIRELKQRVESVLHIMDDNVTFYKDGSSANIAGQKLDEMREKMRTYSKTYQEYYGEPSPLEKSSDIDQDPESLAECRRRKVIKLQCSSFGDIFDLAKECKWDNLKEARDLLFANSDHYNFFDLKRLVCIHLALSSAGEQVMSADEVYQQFVRPLNTLDHSKTDCWSPFFMMMFLWPIPDTISERRDRDDLTAHIDRLQQRWIGRLKHWGQQSSREDKFSCHARFHVKPRTHFFLGHGKDLKSFVHIHEILATQKRLEHGNFWQSKVVKKLLFRLEGTLFSNTTLFHRSSKGKKINVKLAYPYLKHTPSQEIVTFYLGFSWNGPVAYNVIPKGKESCHDTVQRNFNQAYPEHILPINKTRVSPSDGMSEFERMMEPLELEREL